MHAHPTTYIEESLLHACVLIWFIFSILVMSYELLLGRLRHKRRYAFKNKYNALRSDHKNIEEYY